MRQTLLIALLLAVMPVAGSAQEGSVLAPPSWGPRVRATPFIGFGSGFQSKGKLFGTGGNQIGTREYEFEYGSGPVTGLNVEVRAHSRFSALAGVAWSRRGETLFTTDDSLVSDVGSDFLTARVAGGIRLRERDEDLQFRSLSALLFAGAAMIREMPEVTLNSPAEWRDAVTHWGLNLGAEAELPLSNDRLGFTAAIEDYIVFWNPDGVRQHLQSYSQSEFGLTVAETDPGISNMVLIRLGLTFRFGS